jgi:hypothetical protein
MIGNSLGVVLSPGGLVAAERSEGERSELQRSVVATKAGADSLAAARPDPEVLAKAKRRTYTAEYKQRILLEAEAAAYPPTQQCTRSSHKRPHSPSAHVSSFALTCSSGDSRLWNSSSAARREGHRGFTALRD